MKLHRVHMAGRGNATVIFLVALQGIWLKYRFKIHTDINLNKCISHPYKWLKYEMSTAIMKT